MKAEALLLNGVVTRYVISRGELAETWHDLTMQLMAKIERGHPNLKVEIPEQQTFMADDKRVARALSIGGDEINVNVSLQYRAALFSRALESIEDRMSGGQF